MPNNPTLAEEVAVWRKTQQGTVEDLTELDSILARHTVTEDLAAHILDRISEEDVPMNVAADIDQLIYQSMDLIPPDITYAIVHDGVRADGGVSFAAAEVYSTEDAAFQVAGTLGGGVHVMKQITVVSHLPKRGLLA